MESERSFMTNNEFYPCIILPGIGQSKTELTDGAGNRIKNAWPLDIDTDKLLKKIKKPFIKSVILRKDAELTATITKCIEEMLAPLECKNDGTPKHPLRVVSYPYSLAGCSADEKRYIYKMVPLKELGDVIGEYNLYFFAYNSFGEPYKTAEELDCFVSAVKRETGAEKVNFVPVSMGGALATAYFDAFGAKNDVHRVMYFVAAVKGSLLLEDLMSGNLNPSGAFDLISMLADRKTAELLGKAIKLLPKKLSEKMFYSAIDAMRRTVLVKCPSIWSVMPPENYISLRDRYLPAEKYAELRAKTDRFHAAQSRVYDILKERESAGTRFFAAVGCGLPLLPVSVHGGVSSDGIIHSASTSLGAAFAPLGEQLEKTDSGSEYVSPEHDIDASTALFPETTWFFREQQHDAIADNKTALFLALKVLSDESFTDVHSMSELPRFNYTK